MSEQSEANKTAWSYRAYEFWERHEGTPAQAAARIRENPARCLHDHLQYFKELPGKRVVNVLGSNGRRAVPLALLGADVTVIDISPENERYARELAKEADVPLNYLLADFNALDAASLAERYDAAYMEGGILHYFSDLDAFFGKTAAMLQRGGTLILSDFHPVRKIVKLIGEQLVLEGDYFQSELRAGDVAYKPFFTQEEQGEFPDCLLRYWTMGEIVTAVACAGFVIQKLVEQPRYDEFKNIPGVFTLIARKP